MVDMRPVLRKPEARTDFGTKCLAPPGRARLEPTETRPGPELSKHLSYPSRTSTEFFKRPTATARRGQGLRVKGAEEMRVVAIGRAGRLAFPMRSDSRKAKKAKRHLLLLKNFDLWQSRRGPTGGPIATTPLFSAAHRTEKRSSTVFSDSSVREEAFLPAQLPQLAFPQHRATHHRMHELQVASIPRRATSARRGETRRSPVPSGGSDESPASRRREPFA
jgi:hypothetical protein